MRGSGAIMFSMDGGRTIDKNGAINVNKIQRKPWSFTIVFDEGCSVEPFGAASGVVLPVRAEVGDGEREELDHL